jgi:hypothetical protein
VRKLFHWLSLLSLFLLLGVEKTGLQISSDFDAVATEGLKTAHEIDDEARRIYDTQGGVYNRAMDVDEIRNSVQDIGARVIDGEQIIYNQRFTPS